MKYKVGDKVRIKTWDEMVQEFGADVNAIIDFGKIGWAKTLDSIIPYNRICTISEIEQENIFHILEYKGTYDPVLCNIMIKCSANEYYLQQIKDTL